MSAKRQWIARRQKALEAWVEEVKPILALADWTIKIDWDGNEHTHPTDGSAPSATATMSNMPLSKHATMTVSRDLLDITPEERLQVLVHELYHCHVFALHEYSLGVFNKAAKDNELAQELFEEGMRQQVETLVDALADGAWRRVPPLDLDGPTVSTGPR